MKSLGLFNNAGLALFHPLLCFHLQKASSEVSLDTESSIRTESINFKFINNETCVRNGDGFCGVVSLHDASTLYITNNATAILGYPKEMLVGQSFINFLFPRDKITFASQLAQFLQSRFSENGKVTAFVSAFAQGQAENSFCCRIRLYQGFQIVGKTARYKPFQLTIRLKDTDDNSVDDGSHPPYLLLTAIPVVAAYKVPEEIPAMTSFSTRHTAACYFSHIDSGAIPYVGFLPQDFLGFSVFDFYHAHDMNLLKEIYELVIREQGSSVLGKPYRFKVANGCYITLETAWSCFINPWTHKVEFVIGQHRVLKGPSNPDLFSALDYQEPLDNLSNEIIKKSLMIQEEIKTLLSQDHLSVPVVMGTISRTHDVIDSDPSSVVSVSSQEIRYHENIERFFASQQQTNDLDENIRECIQTPALSTFETVKDSRDSGHGSSLKIAAGATNGVDNSHESSSRSDEDNAENYLPCFSLTEEVLSQHNRQNNNFLRRKKFSSRDCNANQKNMDDHFTKNEFGMASGKKAKFSNSMSNHSETMPMISLTPFAFGNFSQKSVSSSAYDAPMPRLKIPTGPPIPGGNMGFPPWMVGKTPDPEFTSKRKKGYIRHDPPWMAQKTTDPEFTSKRQKGSIRRDPPWMAGIEMTPEITYCFQITSPDKERVLYKDLLALQTMVQPEMVNTQLEMLQCQLETGGHSIHSNECRNEYDLGFGISKSDIKKEFGEMEQDTLQHLG